MLILLGELIVCVLLFDLFEFVCFLRLLFVWVWDHVRVALVVIVSC